VLPRAIYAKRGSGDRRQDGPENFFEADEDLQRFVHGCKASHEHVVVECNEWAREGRGAVIIYLDAPAGAANTRPDAAALRSRAHLQIRSDSSIRDWKRRLRARLGDGTLREKVCDILLQQKRYLFPGSLEVRFKIWFTQGGMHVFGSGLARLLEQVERYETLREAASRAKMSYRHAWGLIRNVEKHTGKPLILPHPGGVGGGQSMLSEYGRSLLSTYRCICEQMKDLAEGCFHRSESESRARKAVVRRQQLRSETGPGR